MAAPKGNTFWKLRNKHGRDKLFASPELLWEAACEYFQWCDEHPLEEEKLFSYQGGVTRETAGLMRAYTITGLCFYLGCSESYFREFKSSRGDDNQDFMTVIDDIEKIIYTQKFEGAAAGLLKENIIARDLGLKDKQDVDVTSEGKRLANTTDEELKKEIERLNNIIENT